MKFNRLKNDSQLEEFAVRLNSSLLFFVIAIYPLIIPLSWISGLNKLGLLIVVSFAASLIISTFFLLKSRKLQLLVPDVLVLAYCVIVLVNCFRVPGVEFRARVDMMRYRLLALICIGALFKYYWINKTPIVRVVNVISWLMLIGGFFVSLVALIERLNPALVYRMYNDTLTVHLSSVIAGQRYQRLISTLSNPINMAFYLALSSSASTYVFFENKGFARVVASISSVIFMITLLFSYSRVAYIAWVAIMLTWVVGYLVYRGERPRIKKSTLIIYVISILLVLTSLIATPQLGIGHRFAMITGSRIVSNPRTQGLLEVFREPEIIKELEAKEKPIGVDTPNEFESIDDETTIDKQSAISTVKEDGGKGSLTSDEKSQLVSSNIQAAEGNISNNDQGLISSTQTKVLSESSNPAILLLFGHGIGKTGGASMQFILEVGYASLLHETGLLSLLIILLLLLYCLVASFRIVRNVKTGKTSKFVVLWMFSIIVGFAVSMLAEDTYMQQPFSIYYPIAIFVITYIYELEVKRAAG